MLIAYIQIIRFQYEILKVILKVQSIISKLYEIYLNEKNIGKQLPNLMKILIEKIVIEKVEDSRKNIKLEIYFNFLKNLLITKLNTK